MSDVAAVLSANRAFYRAFAARDIEAMGALWATQSPVACVHPGWDALRDRAAILKSWRNILGNPGAPAVLCENETAHVLGDVAYVLCHEVIEDAYLVATNLFVSAAVFKKPFGQVVKAVMPTLGIVCLVALVRGSLRQSTAVGDPSSLSTRQRAPGEGHEPSVVRSGRSDQRTAAPLGQY